METSKINSMSRDDEYLDALVSRMRDKDTPAYVVDRLARRYEEAAARMATAKAKRPAPRSRTPIAEPDEEPSGPSRRPQRPTQDEGPC